MTEELKETLDLKTEKSETLNLNTFGADKYVKKRCDQVCINLEVGDEVIQVKALSIPQLCSPLASRVDISCFPHLQGLRLADNVEVSQKRISIVIGVDYYYDIVIS